MANIYEVSTEVKEEELVIIPRTIKMPEVRYAAPSGTLAKGDVFKGTFVLEDKDGNIKPLQIDGLKVVMSDWPDAEDEEILAVLYMNFVVSKKPSAILDAPIFPIV